MHSVLRILGYIALWVSMHYACFGTFEVLLLLFHPRYSGPNGVAVRMKENMGTKTRKCNIRRLFRTQLYCILAAGLGIYILMNNYENWPTDWLHLWGDWQVVGFEMAIAHWILAIFEDSISGKEVIGHMSVSTEEARGAYNFYYSGLISHHVLTIMAYSWCLYTHHLSGLGVFGLVFELPIVILNARDAFVTMDNWHVFHDTKQSIPDKSWYFIWVPIFVTWHCTRTAACLLWPLSLMIWRPELNTLPMPSRVMYHFLGFMFNFVNIKLATEVVPPYAVEDLRRTVSKMKAAANETKKAPYGRHPPSADDDKSRSLIGLEELSKHSSSSDLWVCIHHKIYNLTEFAHQHPGGAEVISRVAGRDATAAFIEAGHSARAKKMMAEYEVAHLTPHGYDQKGDMEVAPFKQGDISKPYSAGKRYTGYDHPFPVLIAITVLSTYSLAQSFSEDPIYNSKEASSIDGSDGAIGLDIWGVVASVLFYSAMSSIAQIMFCAVFISDSLETLIGFSHSPSTNPMLSIVVFLFSSTAIYTGIALVLWLACDVSLLSGSLVGGGSMAVSLTSYRISCMIHICGELYLKLKDGSKNAQTLMKKAAMFVSIATVIELIFFRQELQMRPAGVKLTQLLGTMFAAALFRGVYIRLVYFYASRFSRHDVDYTGLGTGCMHYLTTVSSIVMGSLLSFGLSVFLSYSYGSTSSGDMTMFDVSYAIVDAAFARSDKLWIFTCCAVGFSLMVSGSLIRESNAAFTALTKSVGAVLFLWCFGPSSGYAQYVSILITFAGFDCLSKSTSVGLKEKGVDAPRWLYTAMQHEHLWRHVTGMLLHGLIGVPLVWVLHRVSPEYESYFYTGPILDMGPAVDIGVAYQYSAKNQGPPQNFQCNVGYMKSIDEFIRTGLQTKDMIQELMDDPEAGEKGFVADIVAHFYTHPQSFAGLNGYAVREVNLSAWTSDAAAYNWYKNSPAHKEIVKLHYGGGLKNFTPLLASLKPTADRPIRYEVRCDKCRKVVKGPNADKCPFCESDLSHMPYF